MIKTIVYATILASFTLLGVSSHSYAQSLTNPPLSHQEKQAQKAEKKIAKEQEKQTKQDEKDQKKKEKKEKFMTIANQQYTKLQSLYSKITTINKKWKNTPQYNAKLVSYENDLNKIIKDYKTLISMFSQNEFDPSRKTQLQSLTIQSKNIINNIQSEIQSIKKSTKS